MVIKHRQHNVSVNAVAQVNAELNREGDDNPVQRIVEQDGVAAMGNMAMRPSAAAYSMEFDSRRLGYGDFSQHDAKRRYELNQRMVPSSEPDGCITTLPSKTTRKHCLE